MSAQPIIAVTGANGYVGSIIAEALAGVAKVLRLVRKPQAPGEVAWSLGMSSAEMRDLLRANAVECVFHCAWDMKASSLAQLQHLSVEGSERLLEAAREAGVRNFIFISTISAFEGARSAYGQSKLSVEKKAAEYGALVLRLGLVHGTSGRGAFGSLCKTVDMSWLVPLIGTGDAPQYLLGEEALASTVRRAAQGEFAGAAGPVTLANPTPVAFRDLLQAIAGSERKLKFLPIPWRALYFALRLAEGLGAPLKFRSDSVLSFVYQDRRPDFSQLKILDIHVPEFVPAHTGTKQPDLN